MIPINIACEDPLSEAVALKILKEGQRVFTVGAVYRKNGKTYLKQKVNGFNKASRGMPYLFLVDLDNDGCPPELINSWMGDQTKNPNFIFRVAVEEIEAWILADIENFSSFIGVNTALIPSESDTIHNPKEFLINLVKSSSKREIKASIIPSKNSTAKVGPNYNGKLIEFVNTRWSLTVAQRRSKSLGKTINAINSFTYQSAATNE
ncbi:MAG: hypothetical protein COW85_10095 [Ignavibacteria bacterium CG22_combo_CG10-13_8_21_14_all_37_15]|nr:MAG: hypothetical protein COW85_10095 [Ignavibacteria bacterium CG22_combo_CG10-13_8_21_14_all_37_15]